jgi:putative DNA primase/helicase
MVAAKIEGEDGDRRILVRSKSNLGPDDGGFEYSMEMGEALPGIEAASILWGNAITGSARDLLAVASAGPDGEKSAVASAELFLRELLTVTTGQKFVQSEAKEAGHAWATVRRAADNLQVIKKKTAEGWYWQLPQLPN